MSRFIGKVHSLLGPGLLENLYEEAMEHELKSRGIEYKRQKEIEIKYNDEILNNRLLSFFDSGFEILNLFA